MSDDKHEANTERWFVDQASSILDENLTCGFLLMTVVDGQMLIRSNLEPEIVRDTLSEYLHDLEPVEITEVEPEPEA